MGAIVLLSLGNSFMFCTFLDCDTHATRNNLLFNINMLWYDLRMRYPLVRKQRGRQEKDAGKFHAWRASNHAPQRPCSLSKLVGQRIVIRNGSKSWAFKLER
jgi:hypothetical protein